MSIHHHIVAKTAKWLLTQAGLSVLSIMKERLSENIGLSPKKTTLPETQLLLDSYLHRFEELARQVKSELDQDRLVKINSAISQLKMAPKTTLKQEYLANAASKFFDIASLPELGQTGGFPNAQLRSFAYLGIAAVHIEVDEIVAENFAAAISADISTVKLWFGEDIVQKLLEHNPDLLEIRNLEQPTHSTLSQSTSTPTPQSSSTSVTKFTREQMREAIANRVSFKGWNLEEINLAGLDLREVDFRGAILKRANLNDSRLGGGFKSGANLSGTDLSGAQLVRAAVKDANLRSAQLAGANLKNADLSGADLRGADLSSANLSSTRLSDTKFNASQWHNVQAATLKDANLQDARFNAGMILLGVNLQRANLQSADLFWTQLNECDLRDANLRNANLERADLKETVLQGANLQGANLQDTDLRGTNLQYADLRGARLKRARYNAGTQWPTGFDSLLAGAVPD